MTLIAQLPTGLVNLKLVDKTKPISLVCQIAITGAFVACIQYYQTTPGARPYVTIKNVNGGVIKTWMADSVNWDKLSVNEDISSLVQGLDTIDIEYGAAGCHETATQTSVTAAASLSYSDLPYDSSTSQTLEIDGGHWAQADNNQNNAMVGILFDIINTQFDLGIWDGIGPVIAQAALNVTDGALTIWINGKAAIQLSQGLSSAALNLNQDISPYVKQGVNSLRITGYNFHSNNQGAFNIGNITLKFNSILPIPAIIANASVYNNEVETVDGTTSNFVGDVSIYGDKPVTMVIDTKGLATPSKISIPDATVSTKIHVAGSQAGQFPGFDFDVYLVSGTRQYFLKTLHLTADTKVVDLTPDISIIGFQNFVQIAGSNFVGTVRTSFEVDNSKYSKPISVTATLNYFGTTNQVFQVPANSILVASFDHGYVGAIAAVNETGGQGSVFAGPGIGKSQLFDTPSLGLVQSAPPPLPRPSLTVIPTTPGQTTTPGPGPTSQAIVLSKGEKVVLVAGGVSALVLGVAAVFLRKKPHRSQGT